MIPAGHRDVSAQAAEYFQRAADQYQADAEALESRLGPEHDEVKHLRLKAELHQTKAAAIREGQEVLSVEENVTDEQLAPLFAKQL